MLCVNCMPMLRDVAKLTASAAANAYRKYHGKYLQFDKNIEYTNVNRGTHTGAIRINSCNSSVIGNYF